MRIISAFKDYYDYIAHQHIDDKVIYKRQCQVFRHGVKSGTYELVGSGKGEVSGLFKPVDFATIHFCGTQYRLAHNAGTFVYELAEILSLLNQINKQDLQRALGGHGGVVIPFDLYWKRVNEVDQFSEENSPRPSTLNQQLNAPIVLHHTDADRHDLFYTNIRLASIGFPTLVPPQEAFMAIYNAVIPQEASPASNPDDMTRYEAKGFDKKVSFRNRK